MTVQVWRKLRSRMAAMRNRGRFDAELDEELAFHLEMHVETLMRRGLPETEARRQARLDLGMRELHKDDVRAARGLAWIDQLSGDLRFAWRSLLRTPSFALTAMATLGLAIGVNAALYCVWSAYAGRAPAVLNAEGLVDIHGLDEQHRNVGWSPSEIRALESSDHGLAALLVSRSVQLPLRGEQRSLPALGQAVSGNWFAVLGGSTSFGRVLNSDDDRPDAPPVVVLSQAGWRRLTQNDPAVLGKRLRLQGRDFTVVGVMGPEFVGIGWMPPHLWLANAANDALAREAGNDPELLPYYELNGVLDPAVGRDAVQSALSSAVGHLPPSANSGRKLGGVNVERRTSVLPAADVEQLRPLWQLGFAMVILLLLVACANLVNLFLARASARQGELALRSSLGASRGRVVGQLLTEALAISSVSAMLGCALCLPLVDLVHAQALSVATDMGLLVLPLAPDWRVVVFAAVLAIAAGLLLGLTTAHRILRAGVSVGSAGELATKGSRGQSRMRSWLITAQVAASLALLVLSALILANMQRSEQGSLGFDPHPLLSLGHPKPDARLRQSLAALPDVERISAVGLLPLAGMPSRLAAQVDQRSFALAVRSVDDQYFATAGIRVVHGRNFYASEAQSTLPVAIISAATAQALWPGQDPLGRALTIADGPERLPARQVEVVGVAADVTSSLFFFGTDQSALYLPAALGSPEARQLMLRVRNSSPATIERIKAVCLEHDASTICDVLALDALLGITRMPFVIGSQVAGGLGLLALAISCIGLYGMVSFSLAQRSRELAVRLALGASQRSVVLLSARSSVQWALLGVLIGLPLCLVISLFLRTLIPTLEVFNLSAYLLTPLALALIATTAAWLPARRAARVPPMEALREV